MFRYLTALSPKGIPAYMLFTVPVLSSMPALGQISTETELINAISAANLSGELTTLQIADDTTINLSTDLSVTSFDAFFTGTNATITGGDLTVTGESSVQIDNSLSFVGDINFNSSGGLFLSSSKNIDGYVRIFQSESTSRITSEITGNLGIGGTSNVTLSSNILGQTTIYGQANLTTSSSPTLTGNLSLQGSSTATIGEDTVLGRRLDVSDTATITFASTASIDNRTVIEDQASFTSTNPIIFGDNVLIKNSASANIATGSEIEGDLTILNSANVTFGGEVQNDLTIGENAQVNFNISNDDNGEITTNAITVNGNANINGGTLQLNLDANFDASGINPESTATLDIIALTSNTNTLTGDFDTVSDIYDGLLFLNDTVVNSGSSIQLNINRTSFTSVANTNNQRQVANALESAEISSSTSDSSLIVVETSFLEATDTATVRQSLDQVSGAAYATTVSAQLDLAKRQQTAISQQLSPYTSIREKLVWQNQKRVAQPKQISGNWAHIGDGSIGLLANYTFNSGEFGTGISGVDYDGSTFSVGLSKRFNDEWLVGGVVGFGEYDFDFSGSQTGRTKSDTIDTNLFAQYRMGSWYFNGVAGLTFFDSESDRTLAITQGNLIAETQATQESAAFSALFEAGHIFEFKSTDTPGLQENPLNVQPYASAQYSTIGYDSWSETGAGTAGLDIDSGDHNSLELGLGVRVSQRFPITATQSLRAQGRLGLVHDTADTQAEIDASFVNTTQSNMTLEGSDIDDTRVEAGLGVAYDIGRSFTVNVDAQASFGSDRDTVSVRGGFGWTF